MPHRGPRCAHCRAPQPSRQRPRPSANPHRQDRRQSALRRRRHSTRPSRPAVAPGRGGSCAPPSPGTAARRIPWHTAVSWPRVLRRDDFRRRVGEVFAQSQQRPVPTLEQRARDVTRRFLQRGLAAWRGGQHGRRQHEPQEPARGDRGASCFPTVGAPCRGQCGKGCQRTRQRSRGAAAGHRRREHRQRLEHEDVVITGRSQRVREPAQFAAERLDAFERHHAAGERQARAQAPDADAHLVNPFRIARHDDALHVALDLLQALADDRGERFSRRGVGVQHNIGRTPRHGRDRPAQRVAAFGLAARFQHQRYVGR